MKKRALSLTLALTLGLSLASPALAAEEPVPALTPEELEAIAEKYGLEEPAVPISITLPADMGWSGGADDYSAFRTQFIADYTAAHPEEKAAFDAEAWCQESWDWSKAEYMAYMEVDEATFREKMWQDYLSEQASAAYDAQLVEAYRATHPGELEALDLNVLLEGRGYPDPMSSYMSDYGYATQAEAATGLLASYVNCRNLVAENHVKAESFRAEAPESWAGFDADAYFDQEYGYWMDKAKYMAENCLLTEEEFAESLYVEQMSWSSWPSPGSWTSGNELSLLVNGERVDADLTAADGVTYVTVETANALFDAHFTDETVALRTAAQANGYDVVWNANQNQVVLLDKTTLLAEMEEEFAALDDFFARLLAAALPEAGQGYRYTETAKLALTAHNSIDGDKTYNATVKTDMLVKDNVYDMTVTIGVADLLGLLNQATLDKLATQMPKFTLKDLKSLLTGIQVNLIMDLNTGSFAWNLPILASFDATVTADTWYTMSVGEDLSALLTGEWNTGAFLYDTLLSDSEHGWSPTYAYMNFGSSRSALTFLFGADAFTDRNGTLTWKMDAAAVNGLMTQVTGEDIAVFKEYDFTISISDSGKFTSTAAMRLDMDAISTYMTRSEWVDAPTTALISWAMGLLDFRMTAQSEGTADKATETAQIQWKNQFDLTMEGTMTRKKTTDLPKAAPPAEAHVVELGSF